MPFYLSPDASRWDELRSGAVGVHWSDAARATKPLDYVMLVSTAGELGPDVVVTDRDAADSTSRFGIGTDGGAPLIRRLRSEDPEFFEPEILAPDLRAVRGDRAHRRAERPRARPREAPARRLRRPRAEGLRLPALVPAERVAVARFLSDASRRALKALSGARSPLERRRRRSAAPSTALEADEATLTAVREALDAGAGWDEIAAAAGLGVAAAKWRWQGTDAEIAARHEAGRKRAARPSSRPADLPGLSVAEAAAALDVTVQAIYLRVSRGQLRAETVTLPDGRSYKRVFPDEAPPRRGAAEPSARVRSSSDVRRRELVVPRAAGIAVELGSASARRSPLGCRQRRSGATIAARGAVDAARRTLHAVDERRAAPRESGRGARATTGRAGTSGLDGTSGLEGGLSMLMLVPFSEAVQRRSGDRPRSDAVLGEPVGRRRALLDLLVGRVGFGVSRATRRGRLGVLGSGVSRLDFSALVTPAPHPTRDRTPHPTRRRS